MLLKGADQARVPTPVAAQLLGIARFPDQSSINRDKQLQLNFPGTARVTGAQAPRLSTAGGYAASEIHTGIKNKLRKRLGLFWCFFAGVLHGQHVPGRLLMQHPSHADPDWVEQFVADYEGETHHHIRKLAVTADTPADPPPNTSINPNSGSGAIYMTEQDTQGLDTGWVQKGSWNPALVSVSVTPQTATLVASQTQQFAATIATPQTVTVAATSVAAMTKSATSTVTLTPGEIGTITDVQVTSTPTQAVLSYTAPDTNPCTIEVSESPTYVPLVHAVDSDLFSDANTDGGGAVNRIFVIGSRSVAWGRDGLRYSLALQTATVHYFRITCTSSQYVGIFTTVNIALGNTHSDAPLLDPMTPGAYLWPDIPPQRNARIIDPQTGVLVQRGFLLGDYTYHGVPQPFYSTSSGGHNRVCSTTRTANGFFHCLVNIPNYRIMFGFNPDTGEYRNLGWVAYSPHGIQFSDCTTVSGSAPFDPVDANVLYCGAGNGHIYSVRYTGDDVEVGSVALENYTYISSVLTDLTPGRTFQTLVNAYASANNLPMWTGFSCGFEGVQMGRYYIFSCRNGQQDQYGYLGVYDLGPENPKLPQGECSGCGVIAMLPVWLRQPCRWCGLHTYEDPGDVPLIIEQLHYIGSANFQFTLAADVPYCDAPCQSTISVTSSWNPAWGPVPSDFVPGEPVSQSELHWAMPVAVGDILVIDSELMTIVAKNSSRSWVVQRGYSGTAVAFHTTGTQGYPYCTGGSIYWDFLGDPRGLIGSSTTLYRENVIVSHAVSRGSWRIDGGWKVVAHALTDRSSWSQSKADVIMPTSAPFAGQAAPAYCCIYEYHPSKQSYPDTNWWFDHAPFLGGGLDGGDSTATIPMEGNVYRYIPNSLNPKLMDQFAISNTRPLVNVSGPGSLLQPSDNGKFCIAAVAGECWPGSQAGYVYAAVAPLDIRWCGGFQQGNDICVSDMPMVGQAAFQASAWPPFRADNRVDASGQGVRTLIKVYGNLRLSGNTANVKPLADGSWLLYVPKPIYYPNDNPQFLMAKVPPFPQPDGIDRSTFVPIGVQIPAGTPEMDNAVVEFGYTEYGGNCTQRAEKCVANSVAINESDPFSWPTERGGEGNIPGVPCAQGCTVTVPGLSQHVLYYRSVIRDRNNNTITTNQWVPVAVP